MKFQIEIVWKSQTLGRILEPILHLKLEKIRKCQKHVIKSKKFKFLKIFSSKILKIFKTFGDFLTSLFTSNIRDTFIFELWLRIGRPLPPIFFGHYDQFLWNDFWLVKRKILAQINGLRDHVTACNFNFAKHHVINFVRITANRTGRIIQNGNTAKNRGHARKRLR